MKKKILSIIIALIVVVTGVSFIIYNQVRKNNKEYEIEKINKYDYFMYRNEDKFGVINKEGKIVIDATYDEVKIPNPTKSVFVVYDENGSKVLNEKNQEIFKEYEKVEPLLLKNVSNDLVYEKKVMKYQKNGKYGLVDLEEKKIINPLYDNIETLQYKEGELITEKDGKKGVINQKGYVIIENEYDKIDVDGYYNPETLYKDAGYIVGNKTEEGYRYGYITAKGDKYLECKYNDLKRVLEIDENGKIYLLVADNGRYGVVVNKEEIIKNEYQSIIYDMTSSVFIVEKGKNYGALKKDGKEILKCEYVEIDIKGKNIYAKNKEEKVEVYSNNGERLQLEANIIRLEIPQRPEFEIEIRNIDDKTIYQILKNKKSIGSEYMYLQYLDKDILIASKKDGKLGIVNLEGKEIGEFIYSSVQKISETDIIQMMVGTTVKLANLDGNIICEMENGMIDTKNGYTKIYNLEEVKYFDKSGNEVSNIDIYINNKLYGVKENGKWGFQDKNKKNVIKCIYDEVTEFNEYGYAGIKKDGKWGVIDEEGKIIEEPKYKLLGQARPYFIGKYYQVQYGFGQMYYTNFNN